jgi:hypothetical protein
MWVFGGYFSLLGEEGRKGEEKKGVWRREK